MSIIFKIKKALVSETLFVRVQKGIDRALGCLTRRILYSRNPIQNDRIFIMTYDNLYSCNPKYIAEEILRRELPVEIFWACPPSGAIPAGFPEAIHLVRRGSYEMFEAQATARVWIDNALNCVWFNMPKKKNQVYINTWHGSLGIKRLSGNKFWLRRAARCDRTTDLCITNSRFEEDVFRSTFWPSTPLLRYGHARNDVFFHPEEMARRRETVFQKYGFTPGTKLALYAPTFRESGMQAHAPLDYGMLKDALEQRFGGKWQLMIRLHPKDAAKRRAAHGREWITDATDFGDMQDLLPAIDVGISDYSSWVYDFMLTRRPVFLYTPDIADYDQARGFYYPLETTPFPLAHSSAELAERIAAFRDDAYRDGVDRFLSDKGCYEDGRAAERIVDRLEEILGLPSGGKQTRAQEKRDENV